MRSTSKTEQKNFNNPFSQGHYKKLSLESGIPSTIIKKALTGEGELTSVLKDRLMNTDPNLLLTDFNVTEYPSLDVIETPVGTSPKGTIETITLGGRLQSGWWLKVVSNNRKLNRWVQITGEPVKDGWSIRVPIQGMELHILEVSLIRVAH